MLKERKRIRAAAKEIRLQEERKKAASREEAKRAQEAAQQLQNDSKVTRKGKQKLIKPSTPPLIDIEDVKVDFSSIVDVAPTPARTRRSRPVKLPARYCI